MEGPRETNEGKDDEQSASRSYGEDGLEDDCVDAGAVVLGLEEVVHGSSALRHKRNATLLNLRERHLS